MQGIPQQRDTPQQKTIQCLTLVEDKHHTSPAAGRALLLALEPHSRVHSGFSNEAYDCWQDQPGKGQVPCWPALVGWPCFERTKICLGWPGQLCRLHTTVPAGCEPPLGGALIRLQDQPGCRWNYRRISASLPLLTFPPGAVATPGHQPFGPCSLHEDTTPLLGDCCELLSLSLDGCHFGR